MAALKEVYQAIKRQKEQFGTYYKACLHLHTPASYDYKLIKDWDDDGYRKASDEVVFQLCMEKSIFPPDVSVEDIRPEDFAEFKSKKEYLAFLLIANELIKHKYGIVVVADHQTIDGIDKLKAAIAFLAKHKGCEIYPEVICGVEISCADKNHVLCVFENDDAVKTQIRTWLENNIYSVKEGVTCTSRDTLKALRGIGAEGYIAHIDSYKTFAKDHFSGAYKKSVLEAENLFGLSDAQNEQGQKGLMQTIVDKDYHFVLDTDAHDIETISSKPVWIKCEKRRFTAIKEAFHNYKTSILLTEPIVSKSYIEGIYIDHREGGFLRGKTEKEPFVLNFSDELNCLIGGRGAGKSTVLEILEYALAQRCDSARVLEFLCRHGNIYVLYNENGTEYMIEMRTAIKGNADSILCRFGQNEEERYHFHYSYDPDRIQDFVRKRYLDIYQVCNQGKSIDFEKRGDEQALLRRIFDTRYSVNALVRTASDNEISDYIYDILFSNRKLGDASHSITCRNFNGLRKQVNDVQGILEKRAAAVHAVINPFNKTQKGTFQILFRQDNTPNEPDIKDWLGYKDLNLNDWASFCGKNYNITRENVVEYLSAVYYGLGFQEFIKVCVNRDAARAEATEKIKSFCSDMSIQMIDKGVTELSSEDAPAVVRSILEQAVSDKNADRVITYLKKAIDSVETFSLVFNVNNKESARNQKAEYRDVRDCSLGQKVVAMLSFILGYSDYTKDYRPLIIDQPEDNLDNQYIYMNLVQQLRDAKSKRQVIIATHNAAIVTNTNAEQVCVMESDGQSGWVAVRGYVGTNQIKKQIVNYLEGGIESFKHKCEIYHDVLLDPK